MRMEDCPNCGKKTGHKAALGWGTFFAVILTGGLWLLAIPFYPKRCIVCGDAVKQASRLPKALMIILGIVIVIVGGLMLLAGSSPVAAPFIYSLF